MTKTLLTIALLSFLTQACGLGTEVGNGAHDKDKNKEKKSTNTSNNDQTLPENSGPDGSTTDSSNSGEAKTLEYKFDTSILLNNCASPFESPYDGTIDLHAVVDGGRNYLKGAYDESSDSWTLRGSFGKLLATISNDENADDFVVTVQNADGVSLDSEWTCGSINQEATTDGYTYQADLTKDNITARLVWSVVSGAEDTKDSLKSVTITPDTSMSMSIKFEH